MLKNLLYTTNIGNASNEHGRCGDSHDSPTQARARLALHQFLVRRNNEDCNKKKRCQQSLMTAVQ